MATVELTGENFQQVVDESDIVLVDFWAGWCGPCRMFGPVYERVSERNPDIVFGKVDTEAQQELAQAFGISSIPAVAVIREGVAMMAPPGALPERALEDLIAQARGLDMNEVRGRVDAAGTEQ
ncbi:thioredoxin [Solihabitans fulvus]|uniref:Thioredoxin n=1 Tax=Solihabitans fulvus TaxID=1892852 RepID=A0A5B2WZ40_9PSEU|nr:thioredoxin [Solihabitans fulvus]KAA2256318.1 thioredoxin [Solihabitans fulvus]